MLKAKLIKLDVLSPDYDLTYIGGKAAGLSVIARLSLPTPQTWVVTTGLFAAFKEKVRRYLVRGETDIMSALPDLAAQFIVSEIGADLDKLPCMSYAVRSSATIEDAVTQSFAGMFDSILNASPEGLSRAIATVWLSGLGERVRGYLRETAGHSTDAVAQKLEPADWPDMAVVLQPMVDAVYAGVCFSRHPSPHDVRDAGRGLVEIVSGTGERLVQGEASPFSFSGSFVELAACIDSLWINELAAAMAALEDFTGSPVDVEFAVDKEDRLWILQQRPVTVVNECGVLMLTGYRKAYKRTLCSLDIEFLIDGCARYLAPYLELPLDLTRWMVMTTNTADGQQELWVHEQLDGAVIRLIGERINQDPDYMARLACRYHRQHRQILRWRELAWADESLPLEYRLRDFFEFVIPLNAHYYAPIHIIEALSLLLLKKMKKTDRTAAEDDFFALTTVQVTTLGQIFAGRCRDLKNLIVRDLKNLPEEYHDLPTRWQQAVDDLADSLGFLNCHLPYEPPYDSPEVYGFIKGAAPEATEQGEQNRSSSSVEEKYAVVPGWTSLLMMLREWLNRRNQQMEYLYFIYAQARPLLKAVGEKAGLSIEGIWQSSRAALLQAVAAGCGEKGPAVELSKAGAAGYDYSRLCLYHDGCKVCFRDDIQPVLPASSTDGARVLKGRTVFGSGQVEGTVRIAFTPEEVTEADAADKNLIVVTGMTTPDFVPVLTKKAVALITDEGGILCHAAIIAREIRLPCIVGAGIATERLTDGVRVILDLDRGEVRSI